MNITSKFIDGVNATELDKLCKDYSKVKTEYEEIKAEYDRIVKGIKELCTGKDNETSKYFIKMRITPDSFILDSKMVKEKYPEVFEECKKIKNGSSSIQEVLKK